MRTFFIDLACHQGLLACVADNRVVSSFPIDHRVDDSTLIPQIEGLLLKGGWSYSDLTQIACVVGPGGFTSLRVAVSLANALSHELRIPSAGIHLSDLYFARMSLSAETPTSPLTRDLFWMHSTKKNELFIRGFGSLSQEFPEPQCVTLDHLRAVIKEGMQWMGELIPEHRTIVDDAGLQEAPLRSFEDVLPEFLKNQHYKSQTLHPWYGRGW